MLREYIPMYMYISMSFPDDAAFLTAARSVENFKPDREKDRARACRTSSLAYRTRTSAERGGMNLSARRKTNGRAHATNETRTTPPVGDRQSVFEVSPSRTFDLYMPGERLFANKGNGKTTR